MAPNHGNYSMSEPTWGGQDPHGVTTGRHQAAAGAGHHWTERRRRGTAMQIGQQLARAERVASPLDADVAYEFGAAYEAAERAKGHPLVAGAAGVLGYSLVRAWRRGR